MITCRGAKQARTHACVCETEHNKRRVKETMEGGGEVVVMSVALARILISLVNHGLMYEFVGLLLLSFAALLVELAISNHNNLKQFNPRPGTSSGVFIGSLSIPFALVARLCQQTRMASTLDTSREFEFCRLEYWSATVSSVSLLVFAWRTLSYQKSVTNSVASEGKKKAFINSATYLTTICVMTPFLAFLLPLKLTSVAFLVIMSTQLFDYEVRAFPCCASLGEAMLVSNGISVYSINAVAYTFSKIGINVPSLFYTVPSNKDTISAVLQGILIGLMCIPWMYHYLGNGFALVLRSLKFHPTNSTEKLCNAASFYLALFLAFVIITSGWLYFIHDLDSFWVIWVVEFVFQDPQRLYLCGYWMCVLSMCAIPFYMAKSTMCEQIMVRKVFHLMVVIMFVPALLAQEAFLKLAFSVALGGFLVFEMIRIIRIPPLGEFVHRYMTAFTDTRDSELLIISHFSLLLGCALPLWLTNSVNDKPLAAFAGIFSLGIGDTMASVAGYNFGSFRLTINSKKTLEGTIAGIGSMLLVCVAIHSIFMHRNFDITEWSSLIVAVLCTGILEAYTTQLDNIFLPLIFYALLIV